MEEAEKMEALKKVYADTILNTAKEAAARIIVSERKALRFQQDVFAVKEDSLNLLLRLKQMMDSKVAEAEISNLDQRKRIKELETQLHEAEEVVRDLRTELKGVLDELEKVKSNAVHPLDEEHVKGSPASHEDASQSTLDSGPGSMLTYAVKESILNQGNTDRNCCVLSENASAQTEPPRDSPEEDYYVANSDLASKKMISKKPKLCRNGCTQRIQAFEGNLLNVNLPLLGQADNPYSHKRTESIIREHETGEGTCLVSPPKDDHKGLVDKDQNGLEELSQDNKICGKGQAAKFLRRLSSRKRTSRYGNTITTSCIKQVKKGRGRSNLSHCKTYPCPDNNIEPGGDPSRIIDEEANKNSESHMAPVSSLNATDMNPCSVRMDDIGTDDGTIKAGSFHNAAKEDTMLIDESVLRMHDRKVKDSPRVPICKPNPGIVNVPLINSDSKVDKVCEINNGAPAQTVNDRHLKYTFRRKRKKESLSGPDENTSLEKNTSKKRSGEKQSGAPEPQKSNLIIESSRDSRRVLQVARQLISLSQKRWWS